jgi:hypothetical protein
MADCMTGDVATEVAAADFYAEVERLTEPPIAANRPAA